MSDRRIMRECFGLPENFYCTDCEYAEAGIRGDYAPCGQQNCWYSCTVCRYNNMMDDDCPYNNIWNSDCIIEEWEEE